MSIPTNNKANELSYTRFHSRLLFTRIWQQLKTEKDGIRARDKNKHLVHSCLIMPEGYGYIDGYSPTICYDWHKNCILHVTSEKHAQEIWASCSRLPICSCVSLIKKKGVLVGGKERRSFILSRSEKAYLVNFYNKSRDSFLTPRNIHPSAFYYCKVFKDNIKYVLGDHVVMENSMYRGCVKKIFSHEQGGEITVFVMVSTIVHAFDTVDYISGMPLISKNKKNECVNIIRPIDCINHKFFWLQAKSDDMEIAYEVSGQMVRSRLLHIGEPGCVPPWPQEEDYVLAIQGGSEHKEAIVKSVDISNKLVLLNWLQQQENNDWVPWSSILTILSMASINQTEVYIKNFSSFIFSSL